MPLSLDIETLTSAYAAGVRPAEVLTDCHNRITDDPTNTIWLSHRSLDELLTRLAQLERRRAEGEVLPLFGIPFGVKDNIDVAGLPTTAACSAYRYLPAKSARVVERLEAAGAIVLGKTNLDQFATGLSGTRSPYGIPSSVFDPAYISGGSSSGSAVAVANGTVSFALGTDTAGSGRVPAAFNNIVGLKPTKGWLSTSGVVPACRSLDCVSVFAGTVEDAWQVAEIAAGFDDEDPFSRHLLHGVNKIPRSGFRFGIPSELEFFGDESAAARYAESIERLERIGGRRVVIDFAPFRDAGSLLYSGPWVAERLAALGDFAASHAGDMLPVTSEIILGADKLKAVDAFQGFYRLAELARRAEAEWARMDVMLLPTAATTYRIDQMLADPIRLNSRLGFYTTFVNLLDLAAIAVPAGFGTDGLPFGVTLVAPPFQDHALAGIAAALHRALDGATVGATGHALPASAPFASPRDERIELAVCGAHLSGQPLNRELTELGARLVRSTRTASGYRFYALKQGAIAKPGLVFDGKGQGGIELEIWSLLPARFAAFVAAIPPPLGIGTIALEGGDSVKGFLCEAYAVVDVEDITAYGGWRAYRALAGR